MTGRMPALANPACREPANAPLFVLRNGGGGHAARAAEVCNACWDRPECLAWGLEHERSGVWGGHGVTGLTRLRREFGIPLREITFTYATGTHVSGGIDA